MHRFVAPLLVLLLALPCAAAKPKFASPTLSASTPGHAVDVDVPLDGSTTLYLVVDDAGDGFGCDWADWVEPTLSKDGGKTTMKLTDLKWKSARVGFGSARTNANCNGGTMQVAGVKAAHGIGVHANSIIEYTLPAGWERFTAKAGLDDGGTNQGCGSTVKFLVFTEKPDAQFLAARPSGGDGGLRDAADALTGLDVHEELEATLFAAEPILANPTSIDIDAHGRIWVCEVINYRRFNNGDQPEREEGDRILVLQDTNGDGIADEDATKVFYQGRDIDSAHGICVLPTPSGKGTKVIVSAGDKVFVFTDENGDLKADGQDVLFSGIDGVQHDHGIHAFQFGPDGKLYFNFGNAGKHIRDAEGKPIVDEAGNVVDDSRRPYQEGMVFRCNLDGSELETLGWNFRNNWEVAVDSFGTMWQSDNDDDGNRGVRINYVMEFGNYGYKDEITGAGWQSPRTGMSNEIPLRHWHLNDPGVVPNLLQTGAGSPTGICVYEGSLLPLVFQNQIIHCDAGPNVVRAYPVEPDGAGYKATIEDILVGNRDKWFRPSDVCVAPDGSLFVADWYDPGVGGHRMGDVNRGRIFRITPKGHEGYNVPKVDVSTAKGAVEALKSPNLATRYMAWTALHEMGEKALPALEEVWPYESPRLRARVLWLNAKIHERGQPLLSKALEDDDPRIRITAVRAARQIGPTQHLAAIFALDGDPSPAVRREVALAMADIDLESLRAWRPEANLDFFRNQFTNSLLSLARRYDGEDRWSLEALGIAARGRWDDFLPAYLDEVDERPLPKTARDIVWRARTPKALPYLRDLILSTDVDEQERLRYFRAFDFHPASAEKTAALIALVTANHPQQTAITALALEHGASVDLKDPGVRQAVDRSLDATKGTLEFVNLVDTLKVTDRYADLLVMAREHPSDELGVRAISVLLGAGQRNLINGAITGEDQQAALATLEVLGNSGDGGIVSYTSPLVLKDDQPLDRRRAALAAMAKVKPGADQILALATKQNLDEQLLQVAASSLHSAPWKDVREPALKLFPPPPGKDAQPLPPLEELVAMQGDWRNGRLLFHSTATCAKCHKIDGMGKDVGPDLSEIGSKLSRQAQFQSILYPSAGISHNYETYVVLTVDGNQLNGIISSRTDDAVTIKGADAIPRTIKTADIEEIVKQPISLMPADLQKVLTAQELVDVVDFMETLKKKP